jgi:spore germination protein YaaH
VVLPVVQRGRRTQLKLISAALAVLALGLIDVHAANVPSQPSDPTHPRVMQEAAQQVATAPPAPRRAIYAAQQAAPATVGSPGREVFGFALASSLADPTVGYPSWNFGLLSTVAFFGLHVQDDGTFANDSGMTEWNSADLTNLVTTAHARGTKVVLTIIEQDFSTGTPHMCAALAHASTTVSATVTEVHNKGVDGVNVDYEGVNTTCGGSSARSQLTAFASSLRAALPSPAYISIDTYASSASDPAGFFDIPGLKPSVDSFFVMAYDLEYSNYSHTPPGCTSFCLGPTAPLTGYFWNDTTTASQYISAAGASKVILGVPYYGRKSCVSYAAPNQVPTSTVQADTYLGASTDVDSNLVQAGTYTVGRDPNDASGAERMDSWFNPSLGCTREMYWDDTVSLGNKYALVNSDNLRGVGIFNLNYGGGASELWSLLGQYFAVSATPYVVFGSNPQTVTLTNTSTASINVSAVNIGGANASEFAKGTDGCTGVAVAAGGTCTVQFTFTPADNGVRNATATFATNGPDNPTSALVGVGGSSDAARRLWFTWYDHASAGVNAETIHITNPSGYVATGTINLGAATPITFNVLPGQDSYFSFPSGTIGGPLVINSSTVPVIASLRAWYYQSLNETPARTLGDAATTLYLPWYDLESPGVRADTIHVTNPGTTAATGTVALSGAAMLSFNVAGGADTYVTFPQGTIGGPVTINATQPVIASLRAWYYQSFNETLARPESAAAPTEYFPWYDHASAGVNADTIHITNESGATATGSINMAGATAIPFSVPNGQDRYFAFPQGTIGGPVTINSDHPVLTSLRAWYYQSFNEVAGRPGSPSSREQFFPWYDLQSPGMNADTIHITNPSATATLNVTATMPGQTAISFTVGQGSDHFFSFPGGSIGGPVSISADGPFLASLRAWYYQSFNEVPGAF